MRFLLAVATVLGSLVVAAAAQADTITYNFEATADTDYWDGSDVREAFALPTTFSGTLAWKTDTYINVLDSGSDTFYGGPGQVSYTITIAGVTYTGASTEWGNIQVGIWPTLGEFVEIGAGDIGQSFTLEMIDRERGLGVGEVFPTSLPDLSNFSRDGLLDCAYIRFAVVDLGATGRTDVIRGHLTSLTRVEPVPEPTTLALCGLGVAGIALRRRRRSAASACRPEARQSG